MKLLVLWAPLADYTVECFRQLAKKPDVEIYIVYRQGDSNAPFKSFDLSFCKWAILYNREKSVEISKLCLDLLPDVIMMSSWNYYTYMRIAKKSRKLGTYVISSFDGQWIGSMKQRLGIIVSPFYLKPSIDNFLVPGDRQASYAKKLGYNNVLQGYYTANSNRFIKANSFDKKTFIFVGRLVESKGIRLLINVYKIYRSMVSNPWSLIICGKGELSHICNNQLGVIMKDFTQPDDLVEAFSKAQCIILPSYWEPWGVVIHEAALSGLAIICSYACGSSTYFVRDGQNGYVINSDEKSLLRAMLLMSNLDSEQASQMSNTSCILGNLWTTDKWVEYVYRYVCKYNY